MLRVKMMSGNMGKDNGWRRNRWRIVGWSIAVTLLLLPLLAMQITDEVDWNVPDFIVFGGMLFFVGGAFEMATRISSNQAYRAGVGVALAAALILIWVNLAVGIIGNEENPANLMYFGVLAIAFVGVVIARFQPIGMARAMVATALAQVLVAVIALFAGLGYTFLITGAFVAMWLTAAWLFRKSHLEAASQT